MPAANTLISPVRRCLEQLRFLIEAGRDLLGRIQDRVQEHIAADAPVRLIASACRRWRRLTLALGDAAILAGKLLDDPTYRGEPARSGRSPGTVDRPENLFAGVNRDPENLKKILHDELHDGNYDDFAADLDDDEDDTLFNDEDDDAPDPFPTGRSRRHKPRSFESRFAGLGIGQIMERIRRAMGSTTQVGPWVEATLATTDPDPDPPPGPPFTLPRRVWRAFFHPPKPRRDKATGPP